MTPSLPPAIGPLSHHVAALMGATTGRIGPPPEVVVDDALADDDLHRALYCCYELHYRGFAGVDADLEWDPRLLAFRATLEAAFEGGLRDVLPPAGRSGPALRAAIVDEIVGATGPSLSSRMATVGTVREMREFAIHRSAYQLKEADPHTWAIPRFTGEVKAALVHIQADEYGDGRAPDMHATLFADTMRALGLDATYGAYVPVLPGSTLATVNLVSMFGLHRRLRGAAVGHLTVFEMTSVEPMGRYGAALSRLGFGPEARRFYDVHVLADADHQVVALEQMAGAIEVSEPDLAADVLFGVRSVLELERRFSESLVGSWDQGASSLRVPVRLAA